MERKKNIRNTPAVTVHVDHGKPTPLNSLMKSTAVNKTGIRADNRAGEMQYTDMRKEAEQKDVEDEVDELRHVVEKKDGDGRWRVHMMVGTLIHFSTI